MPLTDSELLDQLGNFGTDEMTPNRALRRVVEVRGRCSVARSDERDGLCLLLNHDDVKSVQADWQTFASSPRATRPFAERPAFPPFGQNPPAHTPWRELFPRRVLNRATVSRIRPLVRADAVEQIGAATADSRHSGNERA